jgi:hypothetical protein
MLVRMVEIRKKAFQPAIGALCSISAKTMKPVMMPTRLITTWMNVKVSIDMPRTMALLLLTALDCRR